MKTMKIWKVKCFKNMFRNTSLNYYLSTKDLFQYHIYFGQRYNFFTNKLWLLTIGNQIWNSEKKLQYFMKSYLQKVKLHAHWSWSLEFSIYDDLLSEFRKTCDNRDHCAIEKNINQFAFSIKTTDVMWFELKHKTCYNFDKLSQNADLLHGVCDGHEKSIILWDRDFLGKYF